MKRLYISLFLFLISLKVICQPWAPLGSNEQTSDAISQTAAFTFFSQISTDGVPYVTYIDDAVGANNLGDFKTHAKRFRNGQWEFAGNAISPQFPGSDDFPVALDGNVPYVAYSESFTPVNIQNKLSVKRLNSTTGEWEIVGQQGLSDGAATGTVIAADNGKIYVAYNDGAFNDKITVKRFDNAHPADGWQTVGPPGFSNGFILGAHLVIDNGIPYVAYLDFGDFVYVKKFNGTAWEDVGTNNPTGGLHVVVRSLKFNSAHIPFISFLDATGTGIVRNLNGANAWVTTGGQPFVTVAQTTASLAILHDVLFVAFGKKDNNNVMQVNVKRFNPLSNDWQDVGNQPVTASPSTVNNIALTVSPGNKLLLIFRNLNSGIYAKTFDAATVLPVTLTTFIVTRQNDKALLQWHTATELDNRLFEIEHSTDGTAFTKIGETAAQQPADIPHDYNFIHATPADGRNFYRLKQVDINGNFTYSNIISIVFNEDQRPFITLFPNPVTDVLHTGYSIEGRKEIIIRNAEGKVIKHIISTARSVDINVADLPAGTYFISLYADKIIETRSFVK